jgi:hypothetical protein
MADHWQQWVVSTDMNFSRFACAAVLVVGVAQAASGQTLTATIGNTASSPGVVATAIDVTRLPVDLKRIERQFQQSRIREERNGLNLRYFVEVFAPAPKLVIIRPEDNVEKGQAPYGAPTHRDMLDMMTPQHFRHNGGMNILQRR